MLQWPSIFTFHGLVVSLPGVPLRIVLADAELVEVVVAGDLFERVQLLVVGDDLRLDVGERRLRRRPPPGPPAPAKSAAAGVAGAGLQPADVAPSADGGAADQPHELAPLQVVLLVGDLGAAETGAVFLISIGVSRRQFYAVR